MQTQAAKHSDASMSMSDGAEQFHQQNFVVGTLHLSVARLGKLVANKSKFESTTLSSPH